MIFFVIFLALLIFCLVFHRLTRSFLNPYKLVFVFGKKGSGKSTLIQKLSNKYYKNGWTVYSTEESLNPEILPIDPKNIYNYEFPEHSCIFIDEVSLIWDNRDFKTMDKKVIEWFRYQRHHKCRVFLFSQSFDIDKKLRDLKVLEYL